MKYMTSKLFLWISLGLVIAFMLFVISTFTFSFDFREDYPELTADEIFDNYAEFFSVENDRSDIKGGTFTLLLWEGDTFTLKSDVLPEIHEKERTTKELSEDGRTLTVSTETLYWLEPTALSPIITRVIMIEWDDKEIAIPVRFQIVSEGGTYIDAQTVQALRSLKDSTFMLHVFFNDVNYSNDLPIIKDGRYKLLTIGRTLHNLEGQLKYLAKEPYREANNAANARYNALEAESPEYQTLLEKHYKQKSTDEESARRSELMEQFRQEADFPEREVFLAKLFAELDPTTLLNGRVFILPVQIESINGIEIKSANND